MFKNAMKFNYIVCIQSVIKRCSFILKFDCDVAIIFPFHTLSIHLNNYIHPIFLVNFIKLHKKSNCSTGELTYLHQQMALVFGANQLRPAGLW